MDWSKPIRNLADKFHRDTANMLIVTSALGWFLSSAAQIFAIGVNNKLSPKEKSFLMPQEAYDALTNIFLFVTFSAAAKKLTEKAIDKKLINIIKPEQYKSPILTVVSIVSGAIASNIITPYVRNYLGAQAQKRIIDNRLAPPETPKKPIKPLIINDGTQPINNKFIYPTTMRTSLKV